MEYRKLGHSGLKVSTLCLGTMTFGEPTEGSFMHGVGRREDVVRHHGPRARGRHQLLRHRRRLRPGRPDRARASAAGSTQSQAARRGRARHQVPLPHGQGPQRHRRLALPDRALRARTACAGCRPTASTSTRSTCRTSTRPRRRPCARSTTWCARARCSTSAPATTPPTGWWTACGRARPEHLERFVALQAQYSLVVRDLEREHVPAVRAVRRSASSRGRRWPAASCPASTARAQPPPAGTPPREVEGPARRLRQRPQLADPRRGRRGGRRARRHARRRSRWRGCCASRARHLGHLRRAHRASSSRTTSRPPSSSCDAAQLKRARRGAAPSSSATPTSSCRASRAAGSGAARH